MGREGSRSVTTLLLSVPPAARLPASKGNRCGSETLLVVRYLACNVDNSRLDVTERP